MPTTTKYALPYPSSSDAPNGPVQLQGLAQATEAALGGPAVVVEYTGSQTLANATETALAFDNEIYNEDGLWDSGTPNRITTPATGAGVGTLWAVFAQMAYSQSDPDGARDMWFRISGDTGTRWWRTRDQDVALDPHLSISGVLLVPAGGYIQVITTQVSGGPMDTIGGQTRFAAYRVS